MAPPLHEDVLYSPASDDSCLSQLEFFTHPQVRLREVRVEEIDFHVFGATGPERAEAIQPESHVQVNAVDRHDAAKRLVRRRPPATTALGRKQVYRDQGIRSVSHRDLSRNDVWSAQPAKQAGRDGHRPYPAIHCDLHFRGNQVGRNGSANEGEWSISKHPCCLRRV
ncbi:MAG TPA: hypothetical protein VK741_26625 [Acetobacteraceae bacterium]|nr:hypothetical protein [Acetobacteraceae bacterium]